MIDVYDLYIFDLDGTLIDSEHLMEKAWLEVTREFQLSIPFSRYKTHIGLPFANILDKLNIEDDREDIEDLYFKLTRELSSSLSAIDGSVEFLKFLKFHKKNIALITSKPRNNTEIIVNNLGFLFDSLVCGDDVSSGKPSTAPYELTLKNLNLKNNNFSCIYFGDVFSDFQFAINCGIDFCLVELLQQKSFITKGLYPKMYRIESWYSLIDKDK